MLIGISQLKVRNYRCLGDLSLDTTPINVFFGPNGAGKSTILDALWFFRDCAFRGVESAVALRNHGTGILHDGAAPGEQVAIELANDEITYALQFGISSGRIEPFAGELLRSIALDKILITRTVGSSTARLYHKQLDQHVPVALREPEKISLGLYLDFNASDREGAELERLLRYVRYYSSRSFLLRRLKRQGSEVGRETRLRDRGDNCWSVLRNLQQRQSPNTIYDTIMRLLTKSFPSFEGLVLEQSGLATVYANFRQKGRRNECTASEMSDGQLQMLLLLTALFAEGPTPSILLFDEPEVSLHPWALTILAEAITLAAERWKKQILIATHSPFLVSQFRANQVLATELHAGRAQVRRLDNGDEMQSLLKEAAAGSLYLTQPTTVGIASA